MELIRLNFFAAGILLLASCIGNSRPDKSSSGDSAEATSSSNDSFGKSDSQSTSQLADSASQAQIPFPYSLQQPNEKYQMPKELKEISAIDIYKKSKLVCVEDEDGTVFVFDIKKSDVKRPITFGKKGDYEGIANVHDTIYVLSSNGKLHQILYFDSSEQFTKEISTPLNKDNNTEGLCFDSLNHRLLIACKKDPGNGLKGARTVYAFDLRTMTFNTTPVFIIQLDELKSFLAQHDKQKLMNEEVRNLFDPEKGDLTFQPSEIAIHPLTNDIYMISTVGKLMIVLDRDGKIKFIEPLSADIFKQPEGLCFKRDGTMFISDEGRSGHGNILEFKYQPDAK